jgi:beta-glucosidase
MSMPGDGAIPLLGKSYWADELSRSILNGTIPLDRLNDMVTRIVATWYKMGQDSTSYPLPNFSSNTEDHEGKLYPGALISPSGIVNEFVNVQGDHATVARAVARDAITMLKNSDSALPLSKNSTTKIFVFGTDAAVSPKGPNDCSLHDCNNGVLGMGWGSGTANYPYLDDPLSAIKRVSSNVVNYTTSDTFPENLTAEKNDIAIVFINSASGEGTDRADTVSSPIGHPGQSAGLYAWHDGDALVKAAATIFSTVVVVVHTVGPILMESWIDLSTVKSVIVAHLPGQEAGSSLTDILYGDYSPSGHLPYSIPMAESDYPKSVNIANWTLRAYDQVQDTFDEGLYIDYRSLNKAGKKARFPFGHGLSYTTFAWQNASIMTVTPLSELPPASPPRGSTPVYSNSIPDAAEVQFPAGLKKIWRYLYPYINDATNLTQVANNNTGPSWPRSYPYPDGYSAIPHIPSSAGGSQGGNAALWDLMYTVTLTVKNTGSMPGRAVTQLYVQHPNETEWDTPRIQLRDFHKTAILQAGASEMLTLNVTRKDVSVWDVVRQDWIVPGGDGKVLFSFLVGDSSVTLPIVCSSGGSCQ